MKKYSHDKKKYWAFKHALRCLTTPKTTDILKIIKDNEGATVEMIQVLSKTKQPIVSGQLTKLRTAKFVTGIQLQIRRKYVANEDKVNATLTAARDLYQTINGHQEDVSTAQLLETVYYVIQVMCGRCETKLKTFEYLMNNTEGNKTKEVYDTLKLDQSATSHYLSELQNANLVKEVKTSGVTVWHQIDIKTVHKINEIIDSYNNKFQYFPLRYVHDTFKLLKVQRGDE